MEQNYNSEEFLKILTDVSNEAIKKELERSDNEAVANTNHQNNFVDQIVESKNSQKEKYTIKLSHKQKEKNESENENGFQEKIIKDQTNQEDKANVSKKRLRRKVLLIAVVSLCGTLLISSVLLIVFNMKKNGQLSELNEQVTELTNQNNEYQEKIDRNAKTITRLANQVSDLKKELQSKTTIDWSERFELNFYHNYAVIVGTDDYYYHEYNCDRLDTSSFYIFNIENARSQGYHPCPACQ